MTKKLVLWLSEGFISVQWYFCSIDKMLQKYNYFYSTFRLQLILASKELEKKTFYRYVWNILKCSINKIVLCTHANFILYYWMETEAVHLIRLPLFKVSEEETTLEKRTWVNKSQTSSY